MFFDKNKITEKNEVTNPSTTTSTEAPNTAFNPKETISTPPFVFEVPAEITNREKSEENQFNFNIPSFQTLNAVSKITFDLSSSTPFKQNKSVIITERQKNNIRTQPIDAQIKLYENNKQKYENLVCDFIVVPSKLSEASEKEQEEACKLKPPVFLKYTNSTIQKKFCEIPENIKYIKYANEVTQMMFSRENSEKYFQYLDESLQKKLCSKKPKTYLKLSSKEAQIEFFQTYENKKYMLDLPLDSQIQLFYAVPSKFINYADKAVLLKFFTNEKHHQYVHHIHEKIKVDSKFVFSPLLIDVCKEIPQLLKHTSTDFQLYFINKISFESLKLSSKEAQIEFFQTYENKKYMLDLPLDSQIQLFYAVPSKFINYADKAVLLKFFTNEKHHQYVHHIHEKIKVDSKFVFSPLLIDVCKEIPQLLKHTSTDFQLYFVNNISSTYTKYLDEKLQTSLTYSTFSKDMQISLLYKEPSKYINCANKEVLLKFLSDEECHEYVSDMNEQIKVNSKFVFSPLLIDVCKKIPQLLMHTSNDFQLYFVETISPTYTKYLDEDLQVSLASDKPEIYFKHIVSELQEDLREELLREKFKNLSPYEDVQKQKKSSLCQNSIFNKILDLESAQGIIRTNTNNVQKTNDIKTTENTNQGRRLSF